MVRFGLAMPAFHVLIAVRLGRTAIQRNFRIAHTVAQGFPIGVRGPEPHCCQESLSSWNTSVKMEYQLVQNDDRNAPLAICVINKLDVNIRLPVGMADTTFDSKIHGGGVY
jgi:hypothetical protein